MPVLDVALTAADAHPQQIAGRVACVIDVLRASTTITAALAAGAAAVWPVAGVDDARRLKTELEAGGQAVILAGERNADAPSGFDLGNSPLAFTPETAGGRQIVLTTTNGTHALSRARENGAAEVLVAAFVNLPTLVRRLTSSPAPGGILLYAAGSNGLVSLEDTMCAGMIADRLLAARRDLRLTDAARVALFAYRAFASAGPGDAMPSALAQSLRDGDHARRLLEKGYGRDLDACLQIGTESIVGRLDGARIIA